MDHDRTRKRLARDLTLDLALSEGQVHRWYFPDLDPGRVRKLLIEMSASGQVVFRSVWVGRTARERTVRQVCIVHTPRLPATPEGLRHACGVAEVRRILGAPPGLWRVIAPQAVGDTGEPDAVLQMGHTLTAVEYDAGSYTREQVLRKARAFAQRYDGQVWGAPTRRRAEWIRSLVPDAEVVCAPWF